MTCRRGSLGIRTVRFELVGLALLLTLTVGKGEAQHVIRSWSVAGPFSAEQVVRESYSDINSLISADWQSVETDASGIVDLSRQFSREHPAGDVVIARHLFFSGEEQIINLEFGYAEEVDVFLNAQRWFSGRHRWDHLPDTNGELAHEGPLNARRGLNEIIFVVKSAGEPFGFVARTDTPLDSVP